MKVIAKTWEGEKEYGLEDLLADTIQNQYSESGGLLEDIAKRTRVLANTVARVLTILVEDKKIGLQNAYNLCGGYMRVREEIEENEGGEEI